MPQIIKIINTVTFDPVEVADKAGLSKCPVEVVPVSNGVIKYAGACIPHNATDIFQLECTNIDKRNVPATAACEYIFENAASKDPNYYCSISCEQSSPNVARGLPNYYVSHNSVSMTGAASLIQPSFFLLLSALFITVFMTFKRNH